ncbi:MAG: hypothetical protein GX601_16375 [Anaerolineales bacterium]|nr:hypothetical protein [Anaerolineales bacterium]
MTTTEERLRVLTMIEKGQLSAEEGARLLEALSAAGPASGLRSGPAATSRGPRRMRVRVTDLTTGQRKVDINMPWSLVSVGMSMGARFTPPDLNIDIEQVMAQLDAGGEGKVMDVVDEEDNERVEIFVE